MKIRIIENKTNRDIIVFLMARGYRCPGKYKSIEANSSITLSEKVTSVRMEDDNIRTVNEAVDIISLVEI